MDLRHTPRLFVDADLANGASIMPTAEQAHYLQNVLRLKTGEVLRIFNGRVGEWKASVESLSRKSISLTMQEQTRTQSADPDLWLCAAPIKKAHFDYMIEKATELGVSVIQPILTSRTQIREVNVERCRAIAIEAAEQSDRLSIPEIRKPMTLKALIGSWPAARNLIVCAEWGDAIPIDQALTNISPGNPDAVPLPCAGGGGLGNTPSSPSSPPTSGREVITSAAILTGPEGGLAADELDTLRKLSAAIFVRLGPRILRADTAAIAALTCWQAQVGDWT